MKQHTTPEQTAKLAELGLSREKKIRKEAMGFTMLAPYKTGRDQLVAYEGFVAGAQWADRTALSKACQWLRENAYLFVSEFTGDMDTDGLVENFIKAMEE